MSATVKIAGQTATISEYEWTSDDADLLRVLESMVDPLGPKTSDPDPDFSMAQSVVKALGGEIVSHSEVTSEAGVIY